VAETSLLPVRMPLRSEGQNRKRWRYVGFFGEEVMLCAARAEVGPLGQCFWVLWDRARQQPAAHASLRPGSREVVLDGPRLEIDARGLRASLRLGECAAIEAKCPSPGGRGWGWTRKRSGVPIEGTVETPAGRWEVAGFGVDDESAGYQQRHTSWLWSAGVGEAADGRRLAWNLVEGINDPPSGSERAIWVDGEPFEPAPVRFEGCAAIDLADGARLDFSAESDHARDESFLLIKSRYRHSFGTFSGSLGPGLDLASGLGVMEQHDAVW
jgi:hypothetical protein